MKIKGIPDGWELVRIGRAELNEWYICSHGSPYRCIEPTVEGCAIIKRIEPTKPTYIPWTRDTCPIGSVIVGPIDNVQITRCNKESCYLVSTGYVLFGEMLQSAYRHNGEPCGTKV